MHEHDMSTPIGGCVLRCELHISTGIGHVDIQVRLRCDVIQSQSFIQCDVRTIDGGYRSNFVTGRTLRTRNHNLRAHVPADWHAG